MSGWQLACKWPQARAIKSVSHSGRYITFNFVSETIAVLSFKTTLKPFVSLPGEAGLIRLLNLIGHRNLSAVWLGLDLRWNTCFLRDWTPCSKLVNYFTITRLRGTYMAISRGNKKIFTPNMNEVIIWAPKLVSKMATASFSLSVYNPTSELIGKDNHFKTLLPWASLVCRLVWLPRTDTKTTCVKEIGLHSQNMMTNLGSMVSVMGGGGGSV